MQATKKILGYFVPQIIKTFSKTAFCINAGFFVAKFGLFVRKFFIEEELEGEITPKNEDNNR